MSTNAETKVAIRDLYKIFGPDAAAMTEHVRAGMSKDDLLDRHGHVLGLKAIDLDVTAHHIQVVMGLSGSGKSTLIRHINRLIEPTAGEVRVDGRDVLGMTQQELREFRRSKASMVFQRFALMPHRTVADNVAYGLRIQGIDKAECAERGRRWIDRVGLTGYEDYYTTQLSGGMQQRVGLARALATDAEILLMDEAFSALDPLIRGDMRTLLLDLQRELKKTIVFVTHDLEEAIEIGDRIAILRDGEVIQNGDPQDIVLRPADEYISDFTRNINRGRVLSVGAIMEAVRPGLEGPPECPADTLLADALPIVTTSPNEETPVVDEQGRVVGAISTVRLMVALGGGRHLDAD